MPKGKLLPLPPFSDHPIIREIYHCQCEDFHHSKCLFLLLVLPVIKEAERCERMRFHAKVLERKRATEKLKKTQKQQEYIESKKQERKQFWEQLTSD